MKYMNCLLLCAELLANTIFECLNKINLLFSFFFAVRPVQIDETAKRRELVDIPSTIDKFIDSFEAHK